VLSLINWLMAPFTAVMLFFANGGQQMPEVTVDPDIQYTTVISGSERNTLDVYQTPGGISTVDAGPTAASTHKRDLSPVLLFVHGGGLLIGDKSHFAALGHKFASAGFTTVIPNHRLSPDVSHPGHMKDIASAFAWVHSNIDKYGGDPERIFVAGHSSGGYLAMLLATDPQYLANFGLSPKNIRGVIPVSGFFFIDRLAPGRPESVWGSDSAAWPAASPPHYALENTPPTLLLYAENDSRERRLESIDFARQLRIESKETVHVQEVADRNHATIGIYLMATEDKTSDSMLSFMRQLSSSSSGSDG
jgi:acetyl esterase/lipase